MKFLLTIPFLLAVLLIVSVSIVAALLGLKLVRKKFSQEFLKANHEVGGYIFNAFGLIYAVMVGFVVFATWTEYESSKANVEREANLLVNIYLDAEGLPENMKNEIRSEIIEYVRIVINEEWETMKEGEFSVSAREKFEKIWQTFTKADVSTIKNVPLYQEALSKFNDLSEYRRMRLVDAREDIPDVIWFVLITGFVISLFYTYFFGSDNFFAQSIMTAALTITNVLILFLIYILDHPFIGTNQIRTIAFENILAFMQHLAQ